MSCVFCDIRDRRLPAKIVYEDQWVMAFHDRNPAADLHLLVIPKEHIQTAQHVQEPEVWSHLMTACQTLAKQFNLDGYALVVHCGETAGQTVPHLHVHLMSGHVCWDHGE